MRKKLIYIGTSHNIISIIGDNSDFEIEFVICEKKRISTLYKEVAISRNIEIKSFETPEEFKELILPCNPLAYSFLIYQFDYIVPSSIALKYKMFNLHAGNMKHNRGAHPIIWSVLKGDNESEITLHLINEKIDQGLLIGKFEVVISRNDTPEKIKMNMEKGIPQLLQQMNQFLDGKLLGESISGGGYRKPVTEEDFTINVESDKKKEIEDKIRSQSQYNGAILFNEGDKYYISEMTGWNDTINDKIEIVKTQDIIEINRTNATFGLKINKTI